MSRKMKHGGAQRGEQHPLYAIWHAMRDRCNCSTSKAYKNYGARGIKVCAEWDDFGRFLSDMGPRPLGTSIDRINNDGNYEPGNCRWATRKEQARNTRKAVQITHDGVTRPLREWAELLSISDKTIYKRLRCGQPPLSLGKARNGQAKLTTEQVCAIRAASNAAKAAGIRNWGAGTLAAQFGVHRTQIRRVVRGESFLVPAAAAEALVRAARTIEALEAA